jgi:hypothetical protein
MCCQFFVADPSWQFSFELSFIYLIFVKYNPTLLAHIFFCFSLDFTVSIQTSVISDPGLIPMWQLTVELSFAVNFKPVKKL